MRIIVVVIRALLGVVLLWDALIVIQALGHLLTGGPNGVDGWIGHIALTSRPFMPIVEQRKLIVQAYIVIAVSLATPLVLYLMQRWLKSRFRTDLSK